MANIKLTANEDRFVQAMERASGSVGKLNAMLSVELARGFKEADFLANTLAKGIGRLESETKKAAEEAARMKQAYVQSFRDMGEKMQSVGQTMSTYITLPLTLLAGASLKAYGELDSLKRGLASIEGTSTNVEKRLVQLKEAAKLPGLGFQEAIQGDVRLRSVGIAAETSLRILKEFGNAAALGGGGKEELGRIISQITQMAAKGKVLGQDLRPIIEAAPSVSKALKEMFGTVASDDIQKKLEASGKSSTDFINDLLTALEKTPRVAGGFKNAMENVKDSLFVAAAGFGEALNKSFGLEGILNSLSDKLASLSTWFQGLSPEVQKTIFVVGGLVAVVGPLLVVMGLFTSTVIPAFLTGFGLISGPVLAVGLIITAFTGLVIRNWGMIEAVLKDTGVWDGLVTIVSFAANTIGAIFTLLFQAVTGDWGSFGNGLVNIGKRFLNTLIEAMQMFVNVSLNALQSFFGLFGGTNFMTQGIESVKMMLGSLTSKIMFDVPKSTDYLKKLGDEIDKLSTKKTSTGGGGGAGGNGGKDKKPSKFAYQETKDWTDYIEILQRKVANSFGDINKLEISKNTLNEIKELQKLVLDKNTKVSWADDLLAAAKRLKDGLPQILSQVNLADAGLTIEEQIRKNVTDRAKLALMEFQGQAQEMFVQLQQTLLVDFASGIGEALGGALGGAGFGLQKVFQSILQTIGGFMVTLGKQMLIAGQAIEFAKKTFGTSPAGAIALIAAGGLIKGLAGSLFNNTPKFAQGGMVTGPTFAMMGDNASGREMALPWEKTGVFADAIASKMGGLGGGLADGQLIPILKGEDMYLMFKRYERKNGI